MAEESNSNSDTSNSPNEAPPTSPGKKRTIGEELWEVHLHRREGDKEDNIIADAECEERSAKRSVGEELWQIHLRRSQGVEPDVDQDIDNQNQPEEEEKTKAGNTEQQVIQLRNRTVSIQSH